MPTPSDEDKNKQAEGVVDEGKTGDIGDDSSLADKDTSKFTAEQMTSYIADLKDENAKRRIKARKLEEEIDRQKENQTKTDKEVQAMKDKLTEYEKREKEAADKEKTEIERLTSKLQESENALKEKDTLLSQKDKELAAKAQEVAKRDRESLVDRLCHQLDFNFSSEFERDGFVASLVNVDSQTGLFSLNDEEVIMKVKDFVKTKKDVSKTPGAGPTGKVQETPVSEEIKALLSKKQGLSPEDKIRLDELLEEVGR